MSAKGSRRPSRSRRLAICRALICRRPISRLVINDSRTPAEQQRPPPRARRWTYPCSSGRRRQSKRRVEALPRFRHPAEEGRFWVVAWRGPADRSRSTRQPRGPPAPPWPTCVHDRALPRGWRRLGPVGCPAPLRGQTRCPSGRYRRRRLGAGEDPTGLGSTGLSRRDLTRRGALAIIPAM